MFETRLAAAVEVLSRQRGFVAARAGRNADDPELLALTMEWENIGSYRRALSPYEVKVAAVPLLSEAIDEPTAYELSILPEICSEICAAILPETCAAIPPAICGGYRLGRR